MTTHEELHRAVHELTTTHAKLHHDANGRPRLTREAPLLVTLRAAVTPSGQTHRGPTSPRAGSDAPLSLDALDLWETIVDGVDHAHWAVRSATGTAPTAHPHGPAGVAYRLRWTATQATAHDHAHLCHDFTTWPTAIRRTLEPTREVPLTGHACPICHSERADLQLPTERPDAPAEFTTAPALVVRLTTPPAALCRECGARWTGHELQDLTALLGKDRHAIAALLPTTGRNP